MNKFIVLISGNGTNLEAICKSGLAGNINCVISNEATAKGLKIAENYAISTHVINHKQYKNREEFDKAIALCIDSYTDNYLIVLAGFMRILSPWFVNHYKERLINIHPSLLPSFVGANAQADAIRSRVKVSGATIHFVSDTIDMGSIIAQGIVPVLAMDTLEELKKRILQLEHVLYPFVIKKFLANEIMIVANSQYASTDCTNLFLEDKGENQYLVTTKHDDSDKQLLGDFAPYIFY